MPASRTPPPVAAVADRRDALLETTRRLVGVDTQNPPGDTRELLAVVESSLPDLETERHSVDPARPNLLATLPGDGDRTLCLAGHLDTVPYDGEAWTRDPLGERDGDRVYGRGATDMKGALAAMLTVAQAYVDTGTAPPVTLQFLFVSDEETGGEAGVDALVAADRLDADACVVGETTCEGGRHSVTVADKGSIWLTLTATGEAAHGSRPVLGENAIDRLYGALGRLRAEFGSKALTVDPAMEPIIEESIDYYEPAMGAETARDLFAHPTINLGTIEGGESVNSVPREAKAEVDVRLTASVNTPDVLASIRSCVGNCDGVSLTDVSWSVGTYEPVDSPLVEAVSTVAGDVTGDRIYRRSATGGGDAKTLRNAGVATVEFGLGTDTAHAVDEYTTAAALLGNAKAYARLPYAYAEAVS
ncbi:MAG: M20 family metallopeptidase [Halobacteriaceae archaeon]